MTETLHIQIIEYMSQRVLAQYISHTKILLCVIIPGEKPRVPTPSLLYFTLIFPEHLDVQTRQCRVNKGPHAHATHNITHRHLLGNRKTEH
jgi:hypothetical protein